MFSISSNRGPIDFVGEAEVFIVFYPYEALFNRLQISQSDLFQLLVLINDQRIFSEECFPSNDGKVGEQIVEVFDSGNSIKQ